MKIRKKEQSFGILGKIINSMSHSKNDTYSCDYINNLAPGDALPIGTIVDYEGDTVPDGYEEVSNPTDHSTEEQVVGTWLGKPLYRKVITGQLTEKGSDDFTDINSVEHKLINAYGYIGLTGATSANGTHLGNYINEAWFSGIYLNNLGFQIWYGASLKNMPFEICIEYIKLAD